MGRPRFSPLIEDVDLPLPPGSSMGSILAAAFSPEGALYVLHAAATRPDGSLAEGALPGLVRFTGDLRFDTTWGGNESVAPVGGVPQWPAGVEGVECDSQGNLWVFGYREGDNAVLRYSPSGELLLRIGARGDAGDDADTLRLDRPTSCWHDVAAREVFVADGYGNHRVISFCSDTGAFRRMWGAYGRPPRAPAPGEDPLATFANPVHKIRRGPEGELYVCDRVNNRIQQFALIEGGARFEREVMIAPDTRQFGSAFDVVVSPDGEWLYVADGSNLRVWFVERASFEVRGWASVANETEGEDNRSRVSGLLHRFCLAPGGDLLLCCVGRGLRRMRYLGVH